MAAYCACASTDTVDEAIPALVGNAGLIQKRISTRHRAEVCAEEMKEMKKKMAKVVIAISVHRNADDDHY